MAALVHSWNNPELGHITDDPDNVEAIRTRCGRKIKLFHYGYSGQRDCPRCGASKVFDAIRNQMHQERLKQEEARKQAEVERKARYEAKKTEHAEIADRLYQILVDSNVPGSITVESFARGSKIGFNIGSHKFELKGSF